jgi:hypothetical protein
MASTSTFSSLARSTVLDTSKRTRTSLQSLSRSKSVTLVCSRKPLLNAYSTVSSSLYAVHVTLRLKNPVGVQRGNFAISVDFITTIFRTSTRGSTLYNNVIVDIIYELIGMVSISLSSFHTEACSPFPLLIIVVGRTC